MKSKANIAKEYIEQDNDKLDEALVELKRKQLELDKKLFALRLITNKD